MIGVIERDDRIAEICVFIRCVEVEILHDCSTKYLRQPDEVAIIAGRHEVKEYFKKC